MFNMPLNLTLRQIMELGVSLQKYHALYDNLTGEGYNLRDVRTILHSNMFLPFK